METEGVGSPAKPPKLMANGEDAKPVKSSKRTISTQVLSHLVYIYVGCKHKNRWKYTRHKPQTIGTHFVLLFSLYVFWQERTLAPQPHWSAFMQMQVEDIISWIWIFCFMRLPCSVHNVAHFLLLNRHITAQGIFHHFLPTRNFLFHIHMCGETR